MRPNIRNELNRLEHMSIADLRERFHELSVRRVSIKCKRWYIKRIIWLIQAAYEGEISNESRLLAKQIAADRPFRKSVLRVLGKVRNWRLNSEAKQGQKRIQFHSD